MLIVLIHRCHVGFNGPSEVQIKVFFHLLMMLTHENPDMTHVSLLPPLTSFCTFQEPIQKETRDKQKKHKKMGRRKGQVFALFSASVNHGTSLQLHVHDKVAPTSPFRGKETAE